MRASERARFRVALAPTGMILYDGYAEDEETALYLALHRAASYLEFAPWLRLMKDRGRELLLVTRLSELRHLRE